MKNKMLLVGIAVIAIILAIVFGFNLYFKQKSYECEVEISKHRCSGKPDGTQCTYGYWCDEFGKICGGESCVGMGLGKCYSGECVTSEKYKNLTSK